jgi:hypothetical protein
VTLQEDENRTVTRTDEPPSAIHIPPPTVYESATQVLPFGRSSVFLSRPATLPRRLGRLGSKEAREVGKPTKEGSAIDGKRRRPRTGLAERGRSGGAYGLRKHYVMTNVKRYVIPRVLL